MEKSLIADTPDSQGKWCGQCKQWKPLVEFSKHAGKKDGLQTRCKQCDLAYRQRYYGTERGRQMRLESVRRYQQTERGKESHRRLATESRLRRRLAVIALYGGRCVCCGESHAAFLTIDHVHGDGNTDRKKFSHYSFHLFLLKVGVLPQYQLLCWNCNCGRELNNGVCPHQELITYAA